jgi:hypothetical protein
MASHCHDEHDGHQHHGDGASVHDHSDDVIPALQSLLYDKVDFGNIRTLNETTTGSGAAVVKKPWADRLTPEPELESSADEQLLMFIPYARPHPLPIHSFLVVMASNPSQPSAN